MKNSIKSATLFFICACLFLILAGCTKPFNSAQPTATRTITPAPTFTPLPPPTFTPLPSPTPTQIAGTFSSPYKIGDTVSLLAIPPKFHIANTNGLNEMAMTLVDVKRGEDAKKLAQSNMDWLSYDEPIKDQEYLAVNLKLNLLWYKDNNNVQMIYPYHHLTLRYTENGDDIWSVNPIQKFAEGYPPIEGDGWVFFLIRKDTKPILYFQPDLIIAEQLGYRDGGAYFSLEK